MTIGVPFIQCICRSLGRGCQQTSVFLMGRHNSESKASNEPAQGDSMNETISLG